MNIYEQDSAYPKRNRNSDTFTKDKYQIRDVIDGLLD